MADTETTISSTITVSGEFRSGEPVRVLGKISGRIETTADILIEEGGAIEAEVTTRSLDVHGSIVGNVVASDRFEIHPSGVVTGDIQAPRVILTDGCKYKGHIEVTGSSAGLNRSLSLRARADITTPSEFFLIFAVFQYLKIAFQIDLKVPYFWLSGFEYLYSRTRP